MRLAILGLREPVLVIQLILLDGMQVKAFIRFSATDARSLYLAYHEGYTGFKKKPTEKAMVNQGC